MTYLTIKIDFKAGGELFIGNPSMKGDGLPVPLAMSIFSALADVQDNYNIENGFVDVVK